MRCFEEGPHRWMWTVILIVFCCLFYLPNLGRWDLWNPDEPRYAQVAREMVEGGDWILIHFNGKPYGHKPPFFFWLIGLSSYLWQGFTSFSARFPSAFFGTLAVVITSFFGRSLFSLRAGFLSGLILATSLDFAFLSTRANIDATLTFFTTGALFCFSRWCRQDSRYPLPLPGGPAHGTHASSAREEPPSAGAGRSMEGPERGGTGENGNDPAGPSTRWLYGFYIAMALATLTKGPVGFILPLLVSLIYLALQRDWKRMRAMRLLPGMLLMIAIVLVWYLPAVLKGGEAYRDETLFKHTVDAYVRGWTHVRPIYYYLYNFPVDFLPWILFLPAAIVYGRSGEGGKRREEVLFLLTWSIVIFVFFSLSKAKRSLYLLPLLPAVSLLVGKLWDDAISSSMGRFRMAWIHLPLYAWMGLTFIGGAAIPWVVSAKFPSYLPYGLPLAFLFAGGSLVMFVLLRSKNYCAIFFLLIGIMAGGFFYTWRVVFPLINPYKSARFICQEVTSRIRPGEKMCLYGGIGSGPYNFYTGIVPILELDRQTPLIALLRSSERVFCLLKFRDFTQLQRMEGNPETRVIARRTVGGDDVVLISNR
jgi:4-amino-4-deoxy-L-arabinose transferase-like glycosyltransferase